VKEKKVPVPPRVALVVETSTQFGRTLLAGVAQFVRENGPWSVMFTDRAVNDQPPSWLEDWSGDGIITRVPSPAIRPFLVRKKTSIVDLNEQTADLGFPQISNDHVAIASMAAAHLLERGFRNFAFAGHPGHHWSDQRERTFTSLTAIQGYPCSVYAGPELQVQDLREGMWNTELDDLTRWVAALPKPIGIMASTDFRGLQVLTACRMAGVSVPEEAAVVGVGDDDIACALADPPLSSVVLNAWQMGYRAASLLQRMMQGEKVPKGYAQKVPPLEVTLRRSTDGVAVHDPLVAKAIRFMRANAVRGIQVTDVLAHMEISRTTLQERFRHELGKSVHEMIVEIRLGRIRELLIETEIPLRDVATLCGFLHPEYMHDMMRKRTGWTPGQYRQEFGILNSKRHR